jgi:hypothetical protein
MKYNQIIYIYIYNIFYYLQRILKKKKIFIVMNVNNYFNFKNKCNNKKDLLEVKSNELRNFYEYNYYLI